MTRLSDEEIERGLDAREWRRDGDAIVRELTLENFAAAMALASRVGQAAEAADHHPDILVHGWNRVRLRLTTHSAGGLTQRDLDLSRAIDQLV